MSKVKTLRGFVNQRLTAAAEEIFGLFERMIAEYEEELCQQRKLMDCVVKSKDRLHRADTQLLLVSEEEVPPEQQEWSFSLDQDDPPQLPHVKEEQEELWTSHEGEQLQGLEEDNITFSALPVESEEDDGEKPQSSQLHHTEQMKTESDGEDSEGPEPTRNLNLDSDLQPATRDMTSHSSEPEPDVEETRKPQSGLNSLRNNGTSSTGKTPISSSECVATFGHMGNHQGHSEIQTRVKPFSCSICGKKYNQKNNLTTHVRLHSEGKCFSCSVCNKRFQFRAHLAAHNRSHTEDKPFRCSVCGKTFAQRPHLTTHFRVHTGEKPFTCSVCKVSFSVKTNLVAHMRKHTGEKPFSCSVCGKTFTQKVTMSRHLTVHTEKSFICTICGERYTRLSHMNKHKCVGESSGSR